MCDTLVAVGTSVRGGGAILAKNSDRDPGEPQVVEIVPAAEHADGATVRCTYLTIPQVRRTARVLLSRPAWMWGAEMGVNEHGVAIGNEAVFTRAAVPSGNALLGMDMLRLALERAVDAGEAVAELLRLNAAHPQGGAASMFSRGFRYHSSFLVADRHEAWVVEFAGRDWAADRIATGVRSISNGLTIGANATRASGNPTDDFAARHAARLMPRLARAAQRCSRTTALARDAAPLHTAAAMAVLRDHGPVGADWSPAAGDTGAVCMHASGLLCPHQTTQSLVVHLGPGSIDVWVTGTAAPCISCFVPVSLVDPAPLPFDAPADLRESGASWWWRHERLHRAALSRWPAAAPRLRSAWLDIERAANERWSAIDPADHAARIACSRATIATVATTRQELTTWLSGIAESPRPLPYRRTWRRWAQRARTGASTVAARP